MEDYSDIHPLLSPFILIVPIEWFIYYLSHYSGEDRVVRGTLEKLGTNFFLKKFH